MYSNCYLRPHSNRNSVGQDIDTLQHFGSNFCSESYIFGHESPLHQVSSWSCQTGESMHFVTEFLSFGGLRNNGASVSFFTWFATKCWIVNNMIIYEARPEPSTLTVRLRKRLWQAYSLIDSCSVQGTASRWFSSMKDNLFLKLDFMVYERYKFQILWWGKW